MLLPWRGSNTGSQLNRCAICTRFFDFAVVLAYQRATLFSQHRVRNEAVYTFRNPAKLWLLWSVTAGLLVAVTGRADVWINEILFNPPGTNDFPNEYVELRGTPNLILPNGTYFVAVAGDTNKTPGTIQNVFDLSGRALGGNGHLVLLQNSNSYVLNPNCFALMNTNGSGFGNGATSNVRHRGNGNQTDLENASVTFFLIQSTNFPTPGTDIDANNDGVPDGVLYASWTVIDSVAILDNDGLGDFGYGKINFRRSSGPGTNATVASGTIIPVNFTPSYVGRAGNTTNWGAGSWVATRNLNGSAPDWSLDPIDTEPFNFRNLPLNHIGGPNFGDLNSPGVVARESGFSTDLIEGVITTDSYALGLNTVPSGPVTVTITAGSQVQISTDGGANFASSRTLVFNNTATVNVLVRVLDDNVVDTAIHTFPIRHAITATSDPINYPTTLLTPTVNVKVIENDTLLLSELKVNPPGPEDAPYEFIEIRGPPNATLTNVYLMAIEGNDPLNPGLASVVINLSGERIGSSGLLLIVADGNPYSVPVGTRVLFSSELGAPGGGLGNGSITFLLVSSPAPIVAGIDFDAGNNGILEGLPLGTTVLDSVAWLDGDNDDVIYSTAKLIQLAGTPDAATRIGGNTNANSAAAWVFGNLEGNDPASLAYANEPTAQYGTQLTPGGVNNTAPRITGLLPFSGVIGDPTTPSVTFQIADAESAIGSLTVNVSSDNQSVVPNANLILTGAGATRTLTVNPIAVGYATILISVSDGNMVGLAPIPYAASEDLRGGGRFHTGVSDGSAAIALDKNYMLVADDENQVLRLFSRSNSGPAIAAFDMNRFLDLVDFYEDGRPREIDLEGSTRVGNRLYWIGSHSHNRDFEIRTNRARLFATDLGGSGTNSALTFLSHYDYLKLDLIKWDSSNGHGKGSNYFGFLDSSAPGVDPKAPDGSGFNIEGLAMAPGSTNTAYVCFRAPIVPATNRAKALIVPVTNFAALATGNFMNPGAAGFGVPIELNLGGRGFRSVEGGSNGYLIVAGPPGVALGVPPSDFRLFTWNGFATNGPVERSSSLTNLIPEGIVELPAGAWTSNSMVQLITDSGITVYYNDGVEAKQLPYPGFKKFRSDWVPLGSIVTPQPAIKSAYCAGGSCVITWYSVAGLTYRVQSKFALSDPTWTDAGEVVANDALTSKTIAMAPGQRFFRVIIP